MLFGAHLVGDFPQSQELYEMRNAAKRGRATKSELEARISEDTKQAIASQKGLSFTLDPSLERYSILEPFAIRTYGVSQGLQENWFNNNLFFRQPVIERTLPPISRFPYASSVSPEMFGITNSMALLPSPFTLWALSSVSGYESDEEAINGIAQLIRSDAEGIVANGIRRIQFDEPVFAYKNGIESLSDKDRELINIAYSALLPIEGATTIVHTYFGPVDSELGLLSSLGTDGIGIDMTETSIKSLLKHDFSGKELQLGLIDARSTLIENPLLLSESAYRLAEKTNPSAVYITPNSSTELIGLTHTLEKIKILNAALGELNG
ncbi:MAG: hypothetical protein AABX51_04690 [Nanoarchaeota archaeon]